MFTTAETILLPVLMAAAAGLVGCFAVIRRMSLAADALSHVALPGIGLALMLQLNPLVGAVITLFLGALVVWLLEGRARVGTEAVIGVLFSTALAVGSVMTSGEELIEALFGGARTLTWSEALFGFIVSCAVIAFVLTQRNRLVVMLISQDMARTAGINVRLLNFLYLEIFALTVALGLRYLGALLMGALIIIPAATAKRLAHNLTQMFVVAATIAIIATLAGSWLAESLHREAGPLIVITASLFFVASFFIATRN